MHTADRVLVPLEMQMTRARGTERERNIRICRHPILNVGVRQTMGFSVARIPSINGERTFRPSEPGPAVD